MTLDYQTELAKERNRIAADRTLLAWMRLSLTLLVVGFGVDQSVGAFYTYLGLGASPGRLSHWAGVLLVGLSVYVVVMASLGYRHELTRLEQPDYRYRPAYPLGITVAGALMAIALLCLGRIIWRLMATVV